MSVPAEKMPWELYADQSQPADATAATEQPPWEMYGAEAAQQEPEKASIPRRALRSVEEVGRGLLDFQTNFKGSVANLMEGATPLDETDQYDQWAQEASQRQQELAQQPDAAEETLIGTRGDVRNAMSSLPFSVVSMGGTLASRAAGAASGAAVGSLAGPAGTAAGALVGGIGGGMAGGMAAPYRMDASMFVRQGLEKFSQDYQEANNGREPTRVELLAEQARLQPFAESHGLWEAVPEAAGNLIAAKLFSPLLKPGGNVLVKAVKGIAGTVPEELATETVTQMGQQRTESEAGMNGEAPRSFSDPEAWGQSFEEIKAPVLNQTLLMGAGAGGVGAVYDRITRKKGPLEQAADIAQQSGAANVPLYQQSPIQQGVEPNQDETQQQSQSAAPEESPDINPQHLGAAFDQVSTWWNGKNDAQDFDTQAKALERLGITREQAEQQNLLGSHFDLLPDELKTAMATKVAEKNTMIVPTLQRGNEGQPSKPQPKRVNPQQWWDSQLQTPEGMKSLQNATGIPIMGTETWASLPKQTRNAIKKAKPWDKSSNQPPTEATDATATPTGTPAGTPTPEQLQSTLRTDSEVGGTNESATANRHPTATELPASPRIDGSPIAEETTQPAKLTTPTAQTLPLPPEVERNAYAVAGKRLGEAYDQNHKDPRQYAELDVAQVLIDEAPWMDGKDIILTARRIINEIDDDYQNQTKRTAEQNADKPTPTAETPTPTDGVLPAARPENDNQGGSEAATTPAETASDRGALDQAAHQAATSPQNDLPEPTQAQKEAGNYKKGHADFQGLPVTIENPVGSTRSGTDKGGKPWSITMKHHYGYIKRTEGADGDQVDVFIGPHHDSGQVYVVNQNDPSTGKFDEHKAMLGFKTKMAAMRAYHQHYAKGWKGLGSIAEMPMTEFKDRLKKGEFDKPIHPQAGTPSSSLAKKVEPFKATHELPDGTPVVPHSEDQGVWVDATGQEYEDEATPIKAQPEKPSPILAEEPTIVPISSVTNKRFRNKNTPEKDKHGKYVTPRTTIKWADLPEWIEGNRKLHSRRLGSTTNYESLRQHRGALLGTDLIESETDLSTVQALKESWLNPQGEEINIGNNFKPPKGMRAGSDYEEFINRVNNRITQLQNKAKSDSQQKAREAIPPYPGPAQWHIKPLPVVNVAPKQAPIERQKAVAKARGDMEKGIFNTVKNYMGGLAVTEPDMSREDFDKMAKDMALRGRLHDMRKDYADNEDVDGEAFKQLLAEQAQTFDQSFLDEQWKQFQRAVKRQQVEARKAAHADQIKQAISEGFAEFENGMDVSPLLGAFMTGFEHALDGGTLSNLPTTGDYAGFGTMAKDGYNKALKWLDSDAGKSYKTGKVEKLESVGERLKRAADMRRERLAKLRAEGMTTDEGIRAAMEAVFADTQRADLFPILADPEATPGTVRYIEYVRNQFYPFKEWLGSKLGGGRRRYQANFDTAIFNMLKKGFDSYNDEPFGIETLKDYANEYADYLGKIAREFDGVKSVGQSGKRLHEWLGYLLEVNGADKGRQILDKYIRKVGRFYSALPGYNRYEYLKETEETAIDKTRSAQLVRPKLDKIEREGKDWRQGRNVTLEEIANTFGFAAVTAGDYVTAKQRQDHANYAYDAFRDLADFLGVDPKAISLGGELHFAIGALGSGKFSAHYQHEHPTESGGNVRVINLTNTRGDGAVAHEWFHALDYSLSNFTRPRLADDVPQPQDAYMKAFKTVLQSAVVSREELGRQFDQFLKGGMRWNSNKLGGKLGHTNEAIRRARRSLEALRDGTVNSDRYSGDKVSTGYYAEASKLDGSNKKRPYWSNNLELLARAGESWVYDSLEGENNYLVSDWVEEDKVKAPEYRGRPYPTGEDRKVFNQLFADWFKAIQWDEKGRPTLKADAKVQVLLDEVADRLEFLDEYEKTLPDSEDAIKAQEAKAKADKEAERKRQEKEAEEAAAAKIREEFNNLNIPAEKGGEVKAEELPLVVAFEELYPGDTGAIKKRDTWMRNNIPNEQLDTDDEGIGEVVFNPGTKSTKNPYSGLTMKEGEHGDIRILYRTNDGKLVFVDGKDYLSLREISPSDSRVKLKSETAVPTPERGNDQDKAQKEGWQREDIQTLLDQVREGRIILVATDALGIPTIHDFPKDQVQFLGFGAFKVVTPDYTLTYDGGGEMSRTPNGHGYTTAFVSSGTFPYDREGVIAKLEAALPAPSPAIIEAVEDAKGSKKTLKEELDGLTDDDLSALLDDVEAGMAEAEQEPPRTMAEQDYAAQIRILSDKIERRGFDTPLEWRELFAMADEAFGGTQAEGAYTPKDAYDAVELAVNWHLAVAREGGMDWNIKERLANIEKLVSKLPTQSKRTTEQQEFQQFSTPPSYGLLMGWVADVSQEDVVLEPSAGTGSLIAPWLFREPKAVVANELSPRRAQIVQMMPITRVTVENAEQISNILTDVKPTVVIMNPPFSQTAGRMGDKKVLMAGANHIEQALKMLAPGGRLVALVGKGMAFEAPTYRRWWGKIRSKYSVRANVGIDGKNYTKYGTSFDTRLLVIDNTGPTTNTPVKGDVTRLTDLIEVLNHVRQNRIQPGEQYADKPGSTKTAETGQSGVSTGNAAADSVGPMGAGNAGTDLPEDGGEQTGRGGLSAETGKGQQPGKSDQSTRRGQRRGKGAKSADDATGRPGGRGTASGEPSTAPAEHGVNQPKGTPLGVSDKYGVPIHTFDKVLMSSGFSAEVIGLKPDGGIELTAYKDAGIDRALGKSHAPESLKVTSRFDYSKPVATPSPTMATTPPGKSAADILAEAASHGASGASEALKGLFELFGGNTLKSFPAGLDEDTYKKAKPHFQKAFDEFIAAGNSLKEFVQFIFKNFGSGIKPYLMQFLSEQKQGKLETESTTPDSPTVPELTPADTSDIEDSKKELGDAIFEGYTPKTTFPGAKPHPAPLVESAAMATVDAPKITYVPNISQKLIDKGAPSDAQLEVVAMAGQAHQRILPNQQRQGFLIGDGTGVGKGIEIASILLDNWNQGRKKAVWVSKNTNLLGAAKRDISDLDWDPSVLVNLSGIKGDAKIDRKEGVLYVTYGTLRGEMRPDNSQQGQGNAAVAGLVNSVVGSNVMGSATPRGRTRVEQIVEWLGPDFDGVLVFDEAHAMGAATETKGKRGKKKQSQTAISGMEIQNLLPKARVVYVSATAATEVANLGYMDRLGLWGDQTTFPTKQAFINEFGGKNVSAMELVANNLKAMGLYMSRSIAFQSKDPAHTVTYGMTTHNVDDYQRDMYDTFARSWQIVFQRMDEAMELTGITEEATNGTQKTKNKNAKTNALSAFWGANQRFFNAVLTSLMMPSLVKSMKEDLAQDHSVVIQLVNTNEAAQERAAAKNEAEGTDLMDLDVSPKELLMGFVDKSFPIHQMEDHTDEEGRVFSVPAKDSNGNFVINQEALALKNELMKDLALLKAADNPIDVLVEEFGVDNVAEITGRSRRRVFTKTEHGGREAKWEKRSPQTRKADAEAFQNGSKRVLIFSDAGGTGESYHASLRVKNQQRRIHYLLQPGWRADAAVQGFGRTHRSFQAVAPHYVLLTTDIKGHRRFLSSVARRLDQLGALTRGQRQTTSQGMFSSEFNLENEYARVGLFQLVQDLGHGDVVTEDGTRFGLNLLEDKMGLKLRDAQGNINQGSMPEITQFMNRLLALEIAEQNAVFDAFFERLTRSVEWAKQNGTYDEGLQNIKADVVTVKRHETVYEDPANNLKADYREFELKYRNHPTAFADFMLDMEGRNVNVVGFARNKRSKRVYAFSNTGDRTDATSGRIIPQYRRYGPITQDIIDRNDIQGDKYEVMKVQEAAKAWDDSINDLPEFRVFPYHLLTGTLLPIWNKVKDPGVKVSRIQTADGQRFIGRELSFKVDETLALLGAASRYAELSPRAVIDRVMAGEKGKLADGSQLIRSRVSGDNRVEYRPAKSLQSYESKELERKGLMLELIAYQPRYFVPDSAEGESALGRILAQNALVELTGDQESESTVRYSKLSQSESLNAKRQQLPFKGMTKQAAQGVVNHFLKGYQGLGELKIKVHGSQSEAGRGSNKEIIEAEFHIPTQTLIIISENHRNPAHLLETIREELIGHYALRKLLKKEDHDQLMKEVERAAKANPAFRAEWVKLSGRDPRTGEIINRNAPYFSEGTGYDKAEIADEVISKMARAGVENGWMKRIIDLITRLLRAIGVVRGPKSQREMMALLARAERGLRSGPGAAFWHDGKRFSLRVKPAPQNTIIGYKLLKMKVTKKGQLFPLFVDSTKPTELGVWLDADFGNTGGLSPRPGWHMGDLPIARHIGTDVDADNKPQFRGENQVWVEVEVSADRPEWQDEANRRARRDKEGNIIPKTAEIKDEIPEDGYYRYKTNTNMEGQWIIGGAIKINRILSDEEVQRINSAAGMADLPRKKPLDLGKYGFDQSVTRRSTVPTQERGNEEVRYSKSTPIDPNAAPVFADRVDGYALGNLKDIPKFVKANLQGMRALGLKTLGRQWLTEIYQDDLPGLKAHNKLMMAFDADPNQRQAEAGTVSQEWGGLQREDADSLADIMHVSTVHGVDASKEVYEPRYTPDQVQADFYAELNEVWDVYRKKRAVVKSNRGDPPNDVMYEWQKALSDLNHMTFLNAETLDKMAQAYQKRGIQPDWEDSKPVQRGLKRRIASRMKAERERKAQWEALQSPWRKLSPKARELYNTARDMYQQMWRDTEQAMIERIERTMPEGGSERNRMVDRMRLIFRREVPEVYFPLHRDGEYVLVVKSAPDALGFRKNIGVFREQSLATAERLREELQQRYANSPYEVMPIFKQPIRTRRDAADSSFVAQVINLIGVEGGGHKMDQLRENVMELYYQALPDLSWAKHEMHRRKVPGYSRDARKAFAHHISHGANHLARIRYIDRLEKSLDEMQETVDEHKYSVGDNWDAIKAQDLVNSLKQRHEFAMNPPNVPLANKLTSFGFIWYLGLSPASAIVNMMQTPLVAGPVLGSKYGLLKSTGALVKASGSIMKALRFEEGKGIKGVSPSEKAIVARLKAQLSEDEFRAIEKAIVDGHATVTLAHDLAGVAQGKEHGETMEAVLRAASFMFHQTELFNRLTTILAAYRLGREKGLSHGGAYDQSIDLNYMAHFDYAANNRAPVIAGPVARVVTQFKQYQVNSITLWAHNGVQTLLATPNFLRGKGLDERQKEARRLICGLLLTHAMAAGVLGLPLVGTFLAVASALGSDDDEPWDAEVAFRNNLADWTSPEFAEAVAHGVPRLGRHVLPNLLAPDIAARVGMDRLLFPDLQEGLEPTQWYKEFAVSMLGPVVGAGLNAAKGMQTWGDGDWARGLEEMSPKVLKDALKMGRYAREGVKDKTGVEILDETSWGEMASQLIGFTPARVSEAMESRGAVYNLDRRLTKRRSELMSEYGDAVMNKKSPRTVLAKIREFNLANKQMKITMDGLQQSLKNRRNRVAQAQGGVYLPPKRRGEREVGRFFQG